MNTFKLIKTYLQTCKVKTTKFFDIPKICINLNYILSFRNIILGNRATLAPFFESLSWTHISQTNVGMDYEKDNDIMLTQKTQPKIK